MVLEMPLSSLWVSGDVGGVVTAESAASMEDAVVLDAMMAGPESLTASFSKNSVAVTVSNGREAIDDLEDQAARVLPTRLRYGVLRQGEMQVR